MSDINLQQTTLSGVAQYIIASARQSIDSKTFPRPVLLHSAPGVGKSSLIAQVSEELRDLFAEAYPGKKFRMIDIRVGSMEASEIQGIPFPVSTGEIDPVTGAELKDLNYSTPQWFPREDECGVLFFDEISNAAIPNQHACYRPILDRTIHNGRRIPDSFVMVGAGNRKEDKTGSKGIVPALASRFETHFYVSPNVQEWLDYGMKKGFNEYVLGYIAFAKDEALLGKPNGNEFGYPNPRNWESASGIMNNTYLSDSLKESGVAGCVGSSAQSALIGFKENYRFLPDFDKVARGEKVELAPEVKRELGVGFALLIATSTRIAKAVQDDDFVRAENLCTLFDELDPASASMGIRMVKNASNAALGQIMVNRNKAPKLAEKIDQAVAMQRNMREQNK